MGLTNELIAIFVLRLALAIVFLYMTYFFYKKYSQSKIDGFPNKFFVGFLLMFFILFIVSTVLFSYEVLDYVAPDSVSLLESNFPGYDDPDNMARVWITANLLSQPFYVASMIIAGLVFAGQIYPLEEIIGWSKTPLTKTILILSAMMTLVYIPAITYSIYSMMVVLALMLSVLFAAFINIGVNIKLARSSTGAIRTRSLYILMGLFLFYIGFIWSLEVGWAKLIYNQWGHTEDLYFGVILQIISTIFYSKGFTQTKIVE
jgi:hypothetical protein